VKGECLNLFTVKRVK